VPAPRCSSAGRPTRCSSRAASTACRCSRAGAPARHFPTVARQVYDVTGAGDTVVAACALALGAGASLEAAAVLANQAAGIVVGEVGTATVSAAELRADLKGRKPG
jgi:D-beta-D-heptose 7-phosphate kinase/D-beta-D-heptose 1-phosphate adenosyltransferase